MEEFKKINNKYEVSNLGYIRNIKTGRVLKPWLASGYEKVSIGNSRIKVHRAVGLLFCNKQHYDFPLELNHINCNSRDNRACNLEWITHKQNCNRKKIHILEDVTDNFKYSNIL